MLPSQSVTRFLPQPWQAQGMNCWGLAQDNFLVFLQKNIYKLSNERIACLSYLIIVAGAAFQV